MVVGRKTTSSNLAETRGFFVGPGRLAASGRRPYTFAVKIELNGEAREVREGMTLEGLLGELGLKEPMVATEVNLEIVVRTARAGRVLREGDQVEVVSFVGGG